MPVRWHHEYRCTAPSIRCRFFYLAACLPNRLALARTPPIHIREEFRAMTDRFRPSLTADRFQLSRRRVLTTSAAVAGGIAIGPNIGSARASAAPIKEVRFSEAVHN